MTRALSIRAEAELDTVDAVEWYEQRQGGLGADLLLELDALVERILQSPLQFPRIKNNVRRALLHRFPYSVYFQVGEEMIDLIAVLHQHRNPRTWESRIRT